MRDPAIKAYFGADKISAAKETAKKEWQDAERYVDILIYLHSFLIAIRRCNNLHNVVMQITVRTYICQEIYVVIKNYDHRYYYVRLCHQSAYNRIQLLKYFSFFFSDEMEDK